ncbi:MAG: hypothetical protein JSU00_00970 [Acidobacteria bacterium]|nr:hypothetical protein [Acidobacteriota bacterium]
MRLTRCALTAGVAAMVTLGPCLAVDVGSGAPSVAIQQLFQRAYYRNGFASLVSYPPLADVKKLGSNGLVQEFQDAAKTSGVKYALVLADATAAATETSGGVVQMWPGLYAYYTSLGASTVGMPTMDSANCPALAVANTCTYQFFDKPYVLFVFANAVNNGASTFATRDPYYTKWQTWGGVGTVGPAESAETSVTSKAGTTATAQYFDRGAVYSITSGTSNGKYYAVRAPVYTLYAANGGDQGALGLPLSDEFTLSSGKVRQTFEGGSIDYDPANPGAGATLRAPVSSIVISGAASPVKLNLGETASLIAALADGAGNALTDRQVTWLTSDARVASVQGSGYLATVKATGGGSATVTATAEGKTSAGIKFMVTAPCCQIGEGAPTTAVSQAFQDAVARNRLSVQLPAASGVARVGAGYVQELSDATTGATYLVAVSDASKAGYVVAGAILARYVELGGPAGTLGYPAADASAGGRQLFQNGALAGTPVQVVSGAILTKWAALGYETGVAGSPSGGVAAAVTFRATAVQYQLFTAATVVASGSAKVFAVSGLIQAKYVALGGPAGKLGAPVGDEYTANGRRRQDFEGGSADYAAGDGQANVTQSARTPVVSASPGTALAGTTVRLGAGGFDDGATLKVSMTGQADFTVAASNGAYVWDYYVAASTKSGTVTVRAVDAGNAAKSAQASFAITALADAKLTVAAAGGDAQTGAPGAVLALPMTVAVTDAAGNPAVGLAVAWAASPGARIEAAGTATDANGRASATVRLPASEGVALVTATTNRQVVTLSARAARRTLANFPTLTTAVDGVMGAGPSTIAGNGAMLGATASILRWEQLQGVAGTANGTADVATLNQYLTGYCSADASGTQVCDGYVAVGDSAVPYVNLWRAAAFAGGTLDVAPGTADLGWIRDEIGQGVPVLVALEVRKSGAAAGPHWVAAYGVGADGSVVIADPSPDYARTSLSQYLSGFTVGGQQISATLAGAAAFVAGKPSTGGFLVAANAKIGITSAAGACGSSFGSAAWGGGDPVQFRMCAGTAPPYQLDLAGTLFRGYLTDWGTPVGQFELTGGGAATLEVYRSGGNWRVGRMATGITAGGVVNAATFTGAIAPGGIVTIFGAGLSPNPVVTVGGVAAQVLAAYPFQVNAVVPQTAAAGAATVTVATGTGTASADVTISAVAPALFTLSDTQGAVVNADGTVNSSANPARRGTVILAFGTGFGATTGDGTVARTAAAVTGRVGGISVPIVFAGLAPGFPGLYQLNISLPAGMAPGLALPFSVQQSNIASNTVVVAVQ